MSPDFPVVSKAGDGGLAPLGGIPRGSALGVMKLNLTTPDRATEQGLTLSSPGDWPAKTEYPVFSLFNGQ